MRTLHKQWNSIFLKLIVSFLFVVLPIFVVSLLMNESGRNSVRNEITQSLMTNVGFYRNQLDIEFGKIIDFGREYLFDEDLGRLSVASETMTDFERTKTILRTQRNMLLLKSSSAYISSVSVTIPEINRIITSEYHFQSAPESSGSQYPIQRGPILPIMADDRLVIRYSYPDVAGTEATVYEDRNLMFKIEVELDRKQIEQVLRSFIENMEGGAILSDRMGGWDISSGVDGKMKQTAFEWIEKSRTGGIKQASDKFVIGNKRYMVAFQYSSVLDAFLLVYVPESAVLGPLQNYWKWYWWLSAVSMLAVLFFSYFIYRLIHRPLVTLVRAFRSVENGNFNYSVSYPFHDEFSYLFRRFNEMLEKLKQLIQEVYEQNLRAQISEYRQLQSQINPHFLYNSFFVLSQIAKSRQYDNVMRFTRYLGQYFQFVTRDGEREVPLSAETEFAKTYTEIQSFRFAHRIEVQFKELPAEAETVMVPRIILQPLIENAYHHGLENKKRGGLIKISFQLEKEWIMIAVEDNGDELKDDRLDSLRDKLSSDCQVAESTGIINVHRRLQIRFGTDAGLSVSRSEINGLRVELRIPLKGGVVDVPNVDRG